MYVYIFTCIYIYIWLVLRMTSWTNQKIGFSLFKLQNLPYPHQSLIGPYHISIHLHHVCVFFLVALDDTTAIVFWAVDETIWSQWTMRHTSQNANHGAGIFTYTFTPYLIYGPNVRKYSIHGASGHDRWILVMSPLGSQYGRDSQSHRERDFSASHNTCLARMFG